MKRIIIICVMLTVILSLSGCQAFQRNIKDFGSSITGLNRIMTVYSQDGKVLKTYEGRFDIQETEYGNKIKFELDGKRIMIYNATVIVEEK